MMYAILKKSFDKQKTDCRKSFSIPGKNEPGIRHFAGIDVNCAPAGGLDVNGYKTRLRKKRAQQIAGIAAVRQVVDNKGMFINRTDPGSGKPKAFGGAPDVAVISRHIDNRSIADIQLIGKDAGRQQAAAADGNNLVIVSGIFDFSAEFPGIAMKFFPGDMEFSVMAVL